MNIHKKLMNIRNTIGILNTTVNKDKYSYTPFEDLVGGRISNSTDKTLDEVLKEAGICRLHYGVSDGSDNIIVITELIDTEDGESVKTTESMPYVQVQGMGTIHSRVSISTVLKRTGLVNILGIAFKGQDNNADEKPTNISRVKLLKGSQDWKDAIKSLQSGEAKLSDIKAIYILSPSQEMELKLFEL